MASRKPTELDLQQLPPYLRSRWYACYNDIRNWYKVAKLAEDLERLGKHDFATALYNLRSRTVLADLFSYRAQSLHAQASRMRYERQIWELPVDHPDVKRYDDAVCEAFRCEDAKTTLEFDISDYWPTLQISVSGTHSMPVALTRMCGGNTGMAVSEDNREFDRLVRRMARKLMDRTWKLWDEDEYHASLVTDAEEFLDADEILDTIEELNDETERPKKAISASSLNWVDKRGVESECQEF